MTFSSRGEGNIPKGETFIYYVVEGIQVHSGGGGVIFLVVGGFVMVFVEVNHPKFLF